ncbi:MAG: hypothetical protein J0I12_24045 [Candidatus Eremiobacteraeota bacterium]|nr:hypothetical protein [Candidatus Eremiobacteraeota bacterium]
MREYSGKRLLLCIAMIVGVAGTLQVIVFNKRQKLHFQHHPDQRFETPRNNQDSFVAAGPPVEGNVAAVGMDRIHLSVAGKLSPYRCDNPGQYKIGEKLRVTYAQGSPPTAVRIERL